MQRFSSYFPALVAVLALGAPAVAQTYDLKTYLLDTQPYINQARVPGNPQPHYREMTGVLNLGGGLYQRWRAEHDGQSWRPTDFELWRVSTATIEMLGWAAGDFSDYEVWQPPLALPRSLGLNDPQIYQGFAIRPGGAFPLTATFVLTADRLRVSTPGGTFENCLKFRFENTTNLAATNPGTAPIVSEVTSGTLAPGSGEVRNVECSLDETEPEATVVSGEIWERVPFNP